MLLIALQTINVHVYSNQVDPYTPLLAHLDLARQSLFEVDLFLVYYFLTHLNFRWIIPLTLFFIVLCD
jgi:hypothetical protein